MESARRHFSGCLFFIASGMGELGKWQRQIQKLSADDLRVAYIGDVSYLTSILRHRDIFLL